jgi:hypothetical protein
MLLRLIKQILWPLNDNVSVPQVISVIKGYESDVKVKK